MRVKKAEIMDRIISFTNEFRREYGRSPSTTEIAKEVHTARGTAHSYLTRMRELGMIKYDGKEIITNISDRINHAVNNTPIVGRVVCGDPTEEESMVEEYVDLASEYFKQKVIYEVFAEDDPGRDAFSANGVRPLKVRRNGKTEEIVFPRGTIVLDKYYQNQFNIISRRYNIAHELGHRIYEKIAPGHDAGNYHTIFDSERQYTIDELKEQMSIPEGQATRVGCGLLMPPFLVRNTLYRITDKELFPVYGDHQMLSEDSAKFKRMADDLGVTFNMLMIRLRRLKLLDYRSMEEYLSIVGLEGW